MGPSRLHPKPCRKQGQTSILRTMIQAAWKSRAGNRELLYCSVRELVRQHFRFFAAATLAGLALRLFFVFRFPAVVTDSLVYGDIAKNWLQHGVFGLSGINEISPTYIRLPGYP